MLGEVTLRASLGAALAVLGAIGAIAAGSLTASADPVPSTDSFTVVSAGASAANPDQLSVVVDSPDTITGLTAQFLNGAVDAYDQALTLGSTAPDPTDPTQSETTWTASIPAGTSGLALGSYSITLNGTFSDAGTYSQPEAGRFGFFATAALTLAAANTNLSYPDSSTTLSGTVTLTNPDGTPDTDYTPSSGLTLSIKAIGSEFNQLLPIGSDGTFSDPDFAPSASESVEARIVGGTVDVSSSKPVAFTVTTVTPTLSLKVNPVTETYGKSAIVTGTLSYASGSKSAPVAGEQVWVAATQSSAGALATGTTSASGGFSIKLPERAAGGTPYSGRARARAPA